VRSAVFVAGGRSLRALRRSGRTHAMNANVITSLFLLYSLVAGVVSLFVALALERKLKARNPATRPYRWGFYVGCSGVALTPFVLILALGVLVSVAKGQWPQCVLFLFLMSYFAIQAVCGWFIIQRCRWAWVVGTAATFNIVQWIICGIYAKNRWQEFVGVPYTRPPEEDAYRLLDAATKLEAQGRVHEALAAYQRIAERYSHTGAGRDAQVSIESLRAVIGSDPTAR